MAKKIFLTHGDIVLVDDNDYEWLNQQRWYLVRTKRYRYAAGQAKQGNGRHTTQYMHRFIMNAPKGILVDHIDGDGLNNQRGNLRPCTHQENIHNQRPQGNQKRNKMTTLKPQRSLYDCLNAHDFRGEIYCIKGHSFAKNNTVLDKKGLMRGAPLVFINCQTCKDFIQMDGGYVQPEHRGWK